MKIFLLVVAIAAGVTIYFVRQSEFFDPQVDCPACLGTGRLLANEEACGGEAARASLLRGTDQHTLCFTALPCSRCAGKGVVAERHAATIPKGRYVLDSLSGHSAAVGP